MLCGVLEKQWPRSLKENVAQSNPRGNWMLDRKYYAGEDENVAAQFGCILQTQMFDSFDMDASPL